LVLKDKPQFVKNNWFQQKNKKNFF
jgi:hypothetical protein